MANEFNNKVAILVGVNTYEYVSPLHYARDDAMEFGSVLEKSLGFQPDNVVMIVEDTPRPPTRSKIFFSLGEIKKSKKVKDDDLLLFFFSGHGMISDEDGKDYLLPCDATADNLEQTAVKIEDIAKELKKTGCKNIVMFIDACRDMGGKNVVSIGQEAAEAVRRAGIVTFFSCDPKQKSYEIDALKHGSFTACILEAIAKGEGGSVSVLDSYLRKRVREVNINHKKPEQEPYAIIEPAEKGLLPIFLSAAQPAQAIEILEEWENTLADLFNDGILDLDLFNKSVEYLTTEQSQPNFDRDLRTNLIKRLHEKEMIVAAFVAAWRANERKTSKPKPKTTL